MTIQLPHHFNFITTINSHGWYDLPPFKINDLKTELSTVISLSKTKHAYIRLKAQNSILSISNENRIRLTITEKERIKNNVRSMLRIDEPLDEFHSLCRKETHLRWVPKLRGGRLHHCRCAWLRHCYRRRLADYNRQHVLRKLSRQLRSDGSEKNFPADIVRRTY